MNQSKHGHTRPILIAFITLLLLLGGCVKSPASEEAQPASPLSIIQVPATTEHLVTSRERIYLDPLQRQIHDYLNEVGVDPETIAYTITDYETGKVWQHNETEPFQSGSVYKLPMAMLYYDGLREGWIDPSKMLEYEDWITEPGGIIYEQYEFGDKLPLWEVLDYVIIYSDNVAGHMLYANYGGWWLMRQDATRYSQYTDEPLFFDPGGYFTTRYLNDVMAYLYEHPQDYSRLLDQLGNAAPDTYLNSAHYGLTHQKVGNASYLFNAAGIVYAEHPYSICVLTAFGEFGHQVMGVMNEIVFRILNPEE